LLAKETFRVFFKITRKEIRHEPRREKKLLAKHEGSAVRHGLA
jgi:hypothetical protein